MILTPNLDSGLSRPAPERRASGAGLGAVGSGAKAIQREPQETIGGAGGFHGAARHPPGEAVEGYGRAML
jgi:hypothetical protein